MYLWTGWCICICDVLVDFSVLSQIARATLPEKYIASHVWLPPVNERKPPAPKKQSRNNQKVGSWKYQPWTRMAKEAVLQLKLKLTLCIRDSNEAYPKVRNQPSDGTFWSTTLHLHVLPRAAWVMLELLKVPPRIKSNLSYHSRVGNPALSRLSFVSRLELETNLREVSQWQRGPPPGWKHLLVLVLSHLRHY